ncbi:MAG: hypothetical protein GXN92_02150 [Candidatus Micrarchaeota archaeon]|nr:hypothetical protein [Candidatus Micrarchaeota archaeon]
MKITFSSAKEFSKYIELCSKLSTDALFKLTPDGLIIKALDQGNISLLKLTIPTHAYEADTEELQIGLDVAELKKLIGKAKDDQTLTLEFQETQIIITITKEGITKKYYSRAVDMTGKDIEPKTQYENYAIIDPETFKEIIDDAKKVSTHIKFYLTPDHLEAEAKDMGNVKYQIRLEKTALIDLVCKDPQAAMFPVLHLSYIAPGLKESDVKLYLATAKPLKLGFRVGSADAQYWVAPAEE